MPTRAIINIAGLLLGLALASLALTDDVTAQAPKPGGMLRFAVRGEPSTLYPHRGSSGTDHMTLYPIFDTLVRFDPNLTPQPGLAESWDIPIASCAWLRGSSSCRGWPSSSPPSPSTSWVTVSATSSILASATARAATRNREPDSCV
jgi:ABC-type transport system substrate-binding protein